MNLFRSEEHVVRWLDGRYPGQTISVSKLCDLAHAWWGDRLNPQWEPHSREMNQGILASVGLTGDFWTLPG